MMEETEEDRRPDVLECSFHFSEGDRRRKAGATRALLAASALSEFVHFSEGEETAALALFERSISALPALHRGMINDDPIDVVLPARTDETAGNVNKVNEHDESLPTNRKNFPSRPGPSRREEGPGTTEAQRVPSGKPEESSMDRPEEASPRRLTKAFPSRDEGIPRPPRPLPPRGGPRVGGEEPQRQVVRDLALRHTHGRYGAAV